MIVSFAVTLSGRFRHVDVFREASLGATRIGGRWGIGNSKVNFPPISVRIKGGYTARRAPTCLLVDLCVFLGFNSEITCPNSDTNVVC